MVEAGFGVDADPVETASAWGKIVDSFVTAGNGKVVHEGNGVKAAIGHTQPPDEVRNVGNVLLVGFWGKDNHGEPTGEVREAADPAE